MSSFKRFQVLDGTALKIIAMLCMAADHIGDCFFPGKIWLRAIGRISMPLFAFCVSEGYSHTRDRTAYLVRMLVFGLISEIPFDLFASGKIIDLSQQNIMLTFFWALTGLICYDRITENEHNTFRNVATALMLPLFLAGSVILRLDYNITAVALIFVFRLLRDKPLPVRNTAAMAVHAAFRNKDVNWFGLIGFIPIFMYNGKRGKGYKWLFYIFYPAHMLLIFLIKELG